MIFSLTLDCVILSLTLVPHSSSAENHSEAAQRVTLVLLRQLLSVTQSHSAAAWTVLPTMLPLWPCYSHSLCCRYDCVTLMPIWLSHSGAARTVLLSLLSIWLCYSHSLCCLSALPRLEFITQVIFIKSIVKMSPIWAKMHCATTIKFSFVSCNHRSWALESPLWLTS